MGKKKDVFDNTKKLEQSGVCAMITTSSTCFLSIGLPNKDSKFVAGNI